MFIVVLSPHVQWGQHNPKAGSVCVWIQNLLIKVLLKVPHNRVVATFQDPNKPSRKPLMLSFQNQTSSQTVTPTCQLTPPFPQAIPSLFHETNSISPDKPTSSSGSQTCSAPASPGTSWEPAPYSCPTCSAAAPRAAHLHCANAKKMGTGPAEALLKTCHISDTCGTATSFSVHGPVQLSDMTLLLSSSTLVRPAVAKDWRSPTTRSKPLLSCLSPGVEGRNGSDYPGRRSLPLAHVHRLPGILLCTLYAGVHILLQLIEVPPLPRGMNEARP